MIIQSLDGKWYKEPCWEGRGYHVQTDDDIQLWYTGRVTWSTARRVLAPLGIKAKLDMVLSDNKTIMDGRFAMCSIFKLFLTKPIAEPEWHEGYFDEAPLYEGEVLSWNRCGKRWISTGVKS